MANLQLDDMQIEAILDKLVPLIASDEDREFFRGLLGVYLSEISSGQAAHFIAKLLREAGFEGVNNG